MSAPAQSIATRAAVFNDYLRTPEGQREYGCTLEYAAIMRRMWSVDDETADAIFAEARRQRMADHAALCHETYLLQQHKIVPGPKPYERPTCFCGYCGIGFETEEARARHEDGEHHDLAERLEAQRVRDRSR